VGHKGKRMVNRMKQRRWQSGESMSRGGKERFGSVRGRNASYEAELSGFEMGGGGRKGR